MFVLKDVKTIVNSETYQKVVLRNLYYTRIITCLVYFSDVLFMKRDLHAPKLQCRSEHELTFYWNSTENTFYILEIQRNGSDWVPTTTVSLCPLQVSFYGLLFSDSGKYAYVSKSFIKHRLSDANLGLG